MSHNIGARIRLRVTSLTNHWRFATKGSRTCSTRRSHYVIAACALVCGALAAAQTAQQTAAPTASIVSAYRIAPGKHLDFLKWMATREAVSREAGVPVGRWYVHLNGDSWDFLHIAPQNTPEQDARIDALEGKKGLKSGLAGAAAVRGLPQGYDRKRSLVRGGSREGGGRKLSS